MPDQYSAIKRRLMSAGKPKPEAQRVAAATFNKHRPAGATPMGPNYEQRHSQDLKKRRGKHFSRPVKSAESPIKEAMKLASEM